MSEQTKFTVIVPTRERADTLVHCLRTLVEQDYGNFEVIVSDNFSQDNTKAVVESCADPRVRYINTGKRVSMSHNWEFALGHVKDGWVTFLGDDDGLYPWALRTLDGLIRRYKVEAVQSAFGSFLWPGHFPDSPGGSLSLPLTRSAVVKSTEAEMEKVFSGKALYGGLPWLYLGGAASIDLINRARDPQGRFFCSQIPDIYSAVALSCSTDRYLSVQVPIAISGASRHSNGTEWARAAANKDGKPVPMLKAEGNIPFHDSLVTGKSFQMIWYECYLQSWHIHRGRLGITLPGQLETALRTCPPGQLADIREQCQRIAAKNAIAMPDAGPGLGYRLRSLAALARNVFVTVNLAPVQVNVVNVHDAVRVSGQAYRDLGAGSWGGKLSLALANIRRVFPKLLKKIIAAAAPGNG